MFDKERELVEIGPHSYNLKEGGYGGWDHINDGSFHHIQRCIKSGKRGGDNFWKKFSKENRQEINKQRGNSSDSHMKYMQSKSRSLETCQKRKETMKKNDHSKGNKNSQYGTMWITNEISNRKIKKDDVIPEGWRKGRVIKTFT